MSNVYQDIEDTLNSPGMRHIVKALRAAHKGMYRRYRDCTPEQLVYLQASQKTLDIMLPQIIERLMNDHLVQLPKQPPPRQEWFFEKWLKCPAWWVERIKPVWKPRRATDPT